MAFSHDSKPAGNPFVTDPSERYAVIASRYNEFVIEQLIEGAMAGLLECGVDFRNIVVIRVPGAMEIPVATKWAAESSNFGAIICLGSVIRGATTHYEVVVDSCSNGVSQVALSTGTPVIFGVLATENIDQAIERSDTGLGNKGREFAFSAVEMANLKRSLTSGR